MDRNRKNRKNQNWNNQKKNDSQNNKNNFQNQKTFQFNHTIYEDENSRRENQKAIQEFKARQIVCPMCGAQILDVASALNDKKTGKPVHFECAMESVSKNETLGENEKIAYIGQGRFGVLYFENPRDQRKFTIKKIIEWEDRDSKSEWREEMSNLYSQIQ